MIRVFGLGASGAASLSAEAKAALGECTALFGGTRHLELIETSAAKHPWPKPWHLPVAEIAEAAKTQTVGVLVSGDPSWYSAASGLHEHFETQVWPAPGAFSLAAARQGWALEDVDTGSIHGRGQEAAQDCAAYLSTSPGKHLILADLLSLQDLVAALNALTFSPVQSLTLLCDMGSAAEQALTLDLDAPAWPDTNLFTIAVEIDEQPRLLLDADFLPDEAFETHGKITKFAARQLAIAALRQGDTLWDVGAGAGTVGLQAAYTLQTSMTCLIESAAEALKVLERNCANSSAACQLIEGSAPAALADLPTPDAIFIGGGLSDPAVLATCWDALATGGRLVAHAVTLESEAVLLDFFKAHPEAQLHRHQVSTADPVGGLHGWRPAMPLTQLVIEKT